MTSASLMSSEFTIALLWGSALVTKMLSSSLSVVWWDWRWRVGWSWSWQVWIGVVVSPFHESFDLFRGQVVALASHGEGEGKRGELAG